MNTFAEAAGCKICSIQKSAVVLGTSKERCKTEEGNSWASENALWIKALVAKPDDLSSIPGVNMSEGED